VKILRIIGTVTGDQYKAIHEAMEIWSTGTSCSAALLKRFPAGRLEIHVVSDVEDQKGAIIVIDGGTLGFHPLDEPRETTVH
jgi:hypothetical protein